MEFSRTTGLRGLASLCAWEHYIDGFLRSLTCQSLNGEQAGKMAGWVARGTAPYGTAVPARAPTHRVSS
jgi:hypothetical protein